jgi:hypothetical protein
MSRATRRIVVAHLTDCGMNPADVASELGVSADTVRRDLAAAPAREPEPAAPDAAPPAHVLLLPDDPQLRRNLTVLATAHRASAEEAVRGIIDRAADHVRHRWAAQ